MDWNLRACARHGHETYEPDEPELRQRLHVATPSGPAWRCLRCADFVVGEPDGSGPADLAPEVPRGRLLRDRRIMRLLAIERIVRGLLLMGLSALVFRFQSARGELQEKFNTDLPLLRPLAEQLGWNVDDSVIVRSIDNVFSLSRTVLTWVGIGLVLYALLQFAEGIGLWMMKRWGEYVAAVATGLFLPLEIFELVEKITLLRIVAFAINFAAVVWLVWSKRLFGLRGGAAAYHSEHQAESLLTVERAAVFEA